MQDSTRIRPTAYNASMPQFPFDLHAHSNFSDGDYSAETVFKNAKRLGLQGIVLTDHNTTRSQRSASMLGQRYGLLTIAGIEISARYLGIEIHLLGYAKNFQTDMLERGLRITQDGYNKKAMAQLARANQMGIANLTLSDLRAIRPHAPFFVKYDVARALARVIKKPTAAILKRLNRGGDLYIPYGTWSLSPLAALRLIQRAGGIVSIAHLGQFRAALRQRESYKRANEITTHLLAMLKKNGLTGLELRHKDHSDDDERFLCSIMKKFNLLPTGGSDYHGPRHHPERLLGAYGLTTAEFRAWTQCLF